MKQKTKIETNARLKFRMWDVRNKWFLSWKELGGTISQGYISNPKYFVIQQFTGLKDTWNNDIYDGDILESLWYEGVLYKVVFEDGGFVIYLYQSEKEANRALGFALGNEEFKVVGNIFENPKLFR